MKKSAPTQTLDLAPANAPLSVRAEETAPALSVLDVIARAASDRNVDVAKMSALLDMQLKIVAREAEIEFNRAFAEASREVPRVVKAGVIDLRDKGQIPFAKYEDVDAALRPIEARHGFTRSFRTEPTSNGIRMVLVVSHAAGHSVSSVREMPPDPGPGRNAMQAIGSASSYAKRYLTLDFWNIVTVAADDDGNASGFISEAQVNWILDSMQYLEFTPQRERKLLEFAGAKAVSEIQKREFPRVKANLETLMRKKRDEER